MGVFGGPGPSGGGVNLDPPTYRNCVAMQFGTPPVFGPKMGPKPRLIRNKISLRIYKTEKEGKKGVKMGVPNIGCDCEISIDLNFSESENSIESARTMVFKVPPPFSLKIRVFFFIRKRGVLALF